MFTDMPMFRGVLTDNPTALEKVEPGLLSTFRILMLLQIGWVVLQLSMSAVVRPELNLWQPAAMSLIWMIILLTYLTWPQIERHMGRLFLPVALIAVTIASIAERVHLVYFWVNGDGLPLTEIDIVNSLGIGLLLVLLVPLLIIAWQYGFYLMIVYSVATYFTTLLLEFWLLQSAPAVRNQFSVVGFMVLVTFLLAGYIVRRLSKALRHQQHSLAEANIKLVDYAAAIEQKSAMNERLAATHERNRLAHDLHDTLANSLTAVAVQLDAADSSWNDAPDKAHDILLVALGNVRSGLAETRRAIQNLRAAPLEELGLALALRDLANSTAVRTGSQLTMHVVTAIALPPDIEEGFYRIAQESLTNTVKHANASTITVTLENSDGAVLMEISDDGLGFETTSSQHEGHFGLQGLTERARQIGATLTLQSQPGQGTSMRLIYR